MINPRHIHADYHKTLDELRQNGYTNLPDNHKLSRICGGDCYLMSPQGQIVKVSQLTGEITNVQTI